LYSLMVLCLFALLICYVAVMKGMVSPVKKLHPEDIEGASPGTGSGAGAVGGGGEAKMRSASPMQVRLMQVMSSVEQASESVLKVMVEQRGRGAGVAADSKDTAASFNGDAKGAGESSADRAGAVGGGSSTPSRSKPNTRGHASPSSAAGAAGKYAADIKEVQMLPNHPLGGAGAGGSRDPSIDEDDDLEYTLDNWLTQQKRGVTLRRKNGPHAGVGSGAGTGAGAGAGAGIAGEDVPIEDEALNGYDTILHNHPSNGAGAGGEGRSQAKGGADEGEVQDEGFDFYVSGTFRADSREGYDDHDSNDRDDSVSPVYGRGDSTEEGNAGPRTGAGGRGGKKQDVVRGKYMGNDVEVVGLQCMLAQALMGEGDDDDN
jgi:hypothetical protein